MQLLSAPDDLMMVMMASGAQANKANALTIIPIAVATSTLREVERLGRFISLVIEASGANLAVVYRTDVQSSLACYDNNSK